MRINVAATLLFLIIFVPAVSFADVMTPSNDITVEFDLENGVVNGVSKITIPKGAETVLDLSGISCSSITVNGMSLVIDKDMNELALQPSSGEDIIELRYAAVFRGETATAKEDNPGVVGGNMVSPKGIILMDGWYPSVRGLTFYQLNAVLPEGFEGISEADDIVITERPDKKRNFSFLFPHPVRNVTLVAGAYTVEKDSYNGIDIFTYFLPEDTGLSKTYSEYTKKYLEIYEKKLTPYPFKRFSVVENIRPTGYSMPTFTLLGQDIVRLPFIVETSLGHEVLHQWFGNSVYVDYAGGNWSEGLTTYLGDHLYEEMKGNGWDYRRQSLISFQSYVTPENDITLTSFTGRSDPATKSIGYGKAAMVFHMLKDLAGEDSFYAALKSLIGNKMFKTAAWTDIRDAVESASGKKLDWFFKQWLEQKGGPELEVDNVLMAYRGSRAIVSFDVVRKGGEYRLSLPVTVRTREGLVKKKFDIEKESTSLDMEISGTPLELSIDEDYDIFRKLSFAEYPPVISRLLGAEKRIFVSPAGKEAEYEPLASYLKGIGFNEKKEEEVKYDDLKSSSLVIPNAGSPIITRLFGGIEKRKEDFSVSVRENPYNKDGVIAVVDGEPPMIAALSPRIRHYGKYSLISFNDGKNVLKTIKESQKGLREKIAGETLGVELLRVTTSLDIIRKIADLPVVYVGELHDRFDNHRLQLEVIRSLHEKGEKTGGKIAIGMEMFQKPFQKVLDDYIGGTIDEREFLKKSEYFKRWGFDYNLYREILLYAREFKIPVIALNIKKEIVSKVSKEGLYALGSEELKEVPEDMDLSDGEYRLRLREFFGKHQTSAGKNFDFFYQSQVLWDESMAHNLNDFMKEHPEYQVVVLAGSGHMSFGSGIPKRAHRLNKKDYTIILSSVDIEKDIADYLLFPDTVKFSEAPKLMTVLKEDDGKVRITDFAANSVSEKAGLKKEDVLLSLDNTKVESIDDIKIFLLYKKKGDEVTATVSRQRFLFGPSEMKFKITL